MTEKKKKIMSSEFYNGPNVKRIFDLCEPLVCKKCNKAFEKKSSLKVHVKSHEFDDHTYESKKRPESLKLRPHLCKICEKRFTAKKNLLKHLRVIHKNLNEAEKLQVKKTRCPETNCLFTCHKMRDLRNHIEKYHEIKILKDILQFNNEEDFLKWKQEEEDNSVASFVSYRKKGILRNGTIKKILLCHRTGQYNPKGTGKHRLKSHGSCKIGGTCPAAMEIAQFPEGQITVSYYKTHLGHSQDVIHLQLSREDKAKLSERINQGFSLDAILEDIKESIDPVTGKTKRIHFLSRKDLYNIMQSSKSKKIKNDNDSNSKTCADETLLKNVTNNGKNNANVLDASRQSDEKEEQPKTGRLIIANDQPVAGYECGALLNKSASQLIITTPNAEYASVAELILLPSGENVTQLPVLARSIRREESTLKNEMKASQASPEQWKEEEKSAKAKADDASAKSSLVLKLKEKIEKLYDFIPKSEFLTPKQYEMIDRKLDSIISAFSSVNARPKPKKLNAKKNEKIAAAGNATGNGNSGIESVLAAPQNLVQQPIYDAPLYAYLCIN